MKILTGGLTQRSIALTLIIIQIKDALSTGLNIREGWLMTEQKQSEYDINGLDYDMFITDNIEYVNVGTEGHPDWRSITKTKIKQHQPTNNTCKHKQPWYNKNRW